MEKLINEGMFAIFSDLLIPTAAAEETQGGTPTEGMRHVSSCPLPALEVITFPLLYLL